MVDAQRKGYKGMLLDIHNFNNKHFSVELLT